MKIEGALFDVGEVTVSEGAYARAEAMQARHGRPGGAGVSIHTSVLLKLHATGQWGNIVASDAILNRNNLVKNQGRVLSVIGERLPFVIMTTLGQYPKTFICVPEEV